ncbi:MAG: tetratricopeptide repeat protein, partial [Thermodesulfobacteriota bacterium]
FKCPGCKSILRIKKPVPQKELSLASATSQPSDSKKESNIEQLESESLGPDSEPEIKKNFGEGYHTDRGEEVETPLSEKIEEDISAAPKSLSEEKDTPLIPEDKVVPLKPPGESLLEDYDLENLKEYEEGEAEAGDLEWTRYADKTGPLIPESKIDLNVIPASASDLQETLADLRQAEMYNRQGEANLDKNNTKQAIRDFNHALEINPDYVDALVNRGSAFVLMGKYNDALKDFNHALSLEKKESEIYNIRGEIYLLNKMYAQAIKDFTTAIILNPMYSDAFLNRARAYSDKGMEEEATSDYNQAIKAASEEFSDFADLDSSESLFDEDNSSSKEKAAKYIQQGLADLKRKEYHEAAESFTRAINLSSNDAIGHIFRGLALIKLGKPDEAMLDFNRAVLFDPLNETLYYWRAMAWKAIDSPINMVGDLKLSCELGYEPACNEYQRLKPQKH